MFKSLLATGTLRNGLTTKILSAAQVEAASTTRVQALRIIRNSVAVGSKSCSAVLTRAPRTTSYMGVGEYLSRKSFKTVGLFASMFQNCLVNLKKTKLTVLTTTRGMREETLDGLPPKRITGIRGQMSTWYLRAKEWLSQTFLETIPSFLLILLGNFYSKELVLKRSQSESENVYDLIDVENSHRFQAFNGVVYHNCLGISYLMAQWSLSAKLTADTGEHHTPEQAQELIDKFFEVYSGYENYIQRTLARYSERGFLCLPDGWIMFGDNDNHRSVSNCPIQGYGAVVLRKAIELCQERGLKVIIPLHDALYIQFRYGEWDKIDLLAQCMKEAFCHYFQDDPEIYERSKVIRLDADIWGPELEEGMKVSPGGMPVKAQKIYIDPRAKSEYERFSKYF